MDARIKSGNDECVGAYINPNQARYFSQRDWIFRGQTNEVIDLPVGQYTENKRPEAA